MSDWLTRRRFLMGAAAASFLAGCDSVHPVTSFLNAMKDWNEKFEGLLFSPHRVAPELPLSATTPEHAFPIYYVSDSIPSAPAHWSLKVGGLVSRPMLFSLEQLQRLPGTEMRVQHHCVEGWSAIASWQGVRVSEIARLAGVSPDAKYVEFRSFDANYWSSWDRASALHPQTLLAYGMNGHPLYPEHGAPLRVYSAVKLGYKNVKYLTEVNFLPDKTGGYWENQGYEWFGGV
jgi:DMSO/TMAO reductase YedYZ molybdopterin-dependent catalytic subunit